MSKTHTEKSKYFFRSAAGALCLAALLVLSFFVSLRFGSSGMTSSEFFYGLVRKEGFETQSLILYSVRLPRVLAGIVAGAGLSVSGILLQSITDNALASPNIIGVNSGAGFAVAITLTFFPLASASLPFTAFAGAFSATIIIILISGKLRNAKSSLILAGIALTALLNAGISFLNLLDSNALSSYNAFSVGGLAGVRSDSLIIPAVIIALSFTVSLIFSRRINTLCLGDNTACALGTNVKMLRFICMVCASASAAAAVSFAGLLGFVGLVVPHIARRLVGNDIKAVLPSGTIIGASLILIADLAGRVIASPGEIPVGIMMAFVGAPFFLVLLIKRRSQI